MMQRREKGTGTIYQRENGKWIGRVAVGRGANGKNQYKCFSGKTEAEVKRKIREFNKSGAQADPTKVLFSDYLNDWLFNIKMGKIKNSSFDRLESTAKNHVIPNLGSYKLVEIGPKDISQMMKQMKASGLSYSSIKKAYDCTNSVMEYAFHKRDVEVNPVSLVEMLHQSDFDTKEIRVFSKEETARIVEECGRLYSTGKPVYGYADAFILILHTGLRMGELLGLQKEDIDFSTRKMFVRRNAQVVKKRDKNGVRSGGQKIVLSTTKTYSGSRIISLNSTAYEAAQRLCAMHPESSFVLCGATGKQVDHARFERSFYRLLKNCGIEQTGVHSLRHTFASVLFSQNVDIKTISTLLGHASIKITMDTYVHLMSDTGEQAVEKLNAAI